jgi:type I restriction enzyme S subunit
MTYAEYRDLKNSGIKWLQDIPSHWRIKRLKFSTELVNDKVSVEESSLPYLGLEHIESWTGRRIFGEIANSEGLASAFSTGDLLFGKLRPYLAKVHLAEQEGLISSEALVIRSKAEVHSAFLKYYMLSRDFINIVDSSTYGSKMPRANWDFIGNLPLLLPELEEQQAIARFLDFKTAQIDALIAKKQALLDKLAEKRTALISHAVTKGLAPSVPMKDSGVAWLGEIPAHWDAVRLRHASEFITSGSRGWAEFYSSEGSIFLRITNVSKTSTHLLLDDIQRVSPPDSAEGKRTATRGGDLVISITADLGSVAVIPDGFESAYVSQHLALVRPNVDRIVGQWMAYQIFSTSGQAQLLGAGYGGTKIQLGLGEIKDLWLALPPLNEQQEICSYLSAAIKEMERQIFSINKVIGNLQEYRSALITNAVIGKIDVRAWQPNQEAA